MSAEQRTLSFVFGVLACVLAIARPNAAGLTAPEGLSTAYELILDARFDEAERQLNRACGPAPATSCQVLQAVSAYWRLLIDPENTSSDEAVLAKANAAIVSAESWAAHEPKRAEVWFYLGGAYGTRVLMRGLRNQLVSAARDGKRIHDSLQQATVLDPTLQDAYFGLGLYHYYAAVAPTMARLLRWLLLLPAGNRAGGLSEMQRTQASGMLLKGEADYQLYQIYLWYEHRPVDALRLIEGLHARYPHNPIFALRTAYVQSDYMRDRNASLQTYRSLLEAARAGNIAAPTTSEVSARLGLAQQLDALCSTAAEVDQLRHVIELKPSAPYSALAAAHLQLGTVYDRLGRRSDAVDQYQRAIAATPADDRLHVSATARDRLKRPAIGRVCR
jgi:tetratricopeptide (TPR) repeat protein